MHQNFSLAYVTRVSQSAWSITTSSGKGRTRPGNIYQSSYAVAHFGRSPTHEDIFNGCNSCQALSFLAVCMVSSTLIHWSSVMLELVSAMHSTDPILSELCRVQGIHFLLQDLRCFNFSAASVAPSPTGATTGLAALSTFPFTFCEVESLGLRRAR
jgi:hypothetical protein